MQGKPGGAAPPPLPPPPALQAALPRIGVARPPACRPGSTGRCSEGLEPAGELGERLHAPAKARVDRSVASRLTMQDRASEARLALTCVGSLLGLLCRPLRPSLRAHRRCSPWLHVWEIAASGRLQAARQQLPPARRVAFLQRCPSASRSQPGVSLHYTHAQTEITEDMN